MHRIDLLLNAVAQTARDGAAPAPPPHLVCRLEGPATLHIRRLSRPARDLQAEARAGGRQGVADTT